MTLKDQSQGHSNFVRPYQIVLGYMLLLNIHTKAYMGSPMVCLHFALVTLKSQCQGHTDFEGLYVINEPRLAKCY